LTVDLLVQVVVPGSASLTSMMGKEPAIEEIAEVDHEDGRSKHGKE
jgi:hypothetical protein